MFGTVLERIPTVDNMISEAELISRPNTSRKSASHRADHTGGIKRANHHKNTNEKKQCGPINVRQDAEDCIDTAQVDGQKYQRRPNDRRSRWPEPSRKVFAKDEQCHHQRQ